MNRPVFITIACCLLITWAIQPTMAASNTIYAIDPQARALLNSVQTTYSSMTSLSEQVTSQESSKLPDPVLLHTSIKVMRPGYLSVNSDSKSSRSGSSSVIIDGLHCFVSAPQYPSRYLQFSVPQSARALQLALPEGITSSFTLALFSDPLAIQKMLPDRNLATLQLSKATKVAGVSSDVVIATDISGACLTFYVGHTDHLIRKIVVLDPNKQGEFTETYSSIIINPPLKPTDFSFAPVANAQPFYGSSFSQAREDPPN